MDSITEEDRRALMAVDVPASSTYSGQINYHYPQPGLIRRSLPNMAHSILVHEPAKIYPYHLLLITNYRLPSDVDRCNLEVSRLFIVPFVALLAGDLVVGLNGPIDRCLVFSSLLIQRHLSDVEFEAILQCSRSEFYRLPQWRRNELKRRARLF